MSKSAFCLFVPSNDSMVHWMLPITKRLGDSSFMVLTQRGENADLALQSRGIKFFHYKPGLLGTIHPAIVILGNDWGREERQIVIEARYLEIPSVCIQEGVVRLEGDELLNAEYTFVHGSEILKYIHRDKITITGNPKYDDLNNIPLPSVERVMINCSFLYGNMEENRMQWVNDIVTVCKKMHLDFQISQHPRDKGLLPDSYPVIHSDAFSVKEQLTNSSILVTRFSTIMYEACMAGRAVIYYNPFEENFKLLQEDYGALFIAKTPKELERAFQDAILARDNLSKAHNKFLLHHCGTVNFDASERCENAICKVLDEHEKRTKTTLNKSNEFDNDYYRLTRYLKHVEELFDWREGWLASKEQEVQKIHEQLADYQKQETAVNENIEENRRIVEKLIPKITEYEMQVAVLNQTISERNTQITNLNQWVTDKLRQNESLQHIVFERDSNITKLKKEVFENEQRINELNQVIVKSGLQITDLCKSVAERDMHITEEDQTIKKNESRILQLDQTVKDLNEKIDGKDQTIHELTKIVEENGKSIVKLTDQVSTIANSSGWALLQSLWSIRLWLAPRNSRREKIFLWLKRGPLNKGKKNSTSIWSRFLQNKKVYQALRNIYRKLPAHFERKNYWAKKILSNVPEFQHTKLQIQTDQTSVITNVFSASNENGLLIPPRKRVLVVEHRLPTPDKNSSSLRIYSILKLIAGLGWEFTFVSDSLATNYNWILSDIKKELPKYENLLMGLGGTFKYGKQVLIDHLKSEGGSYRFAILSYPEIMYSYSPLVRAFMPNAKLVYDTVDLHGVRFYREAIIKNNDASLLEKAKYYNNMECANFESSDIVIAITDQERKEILKRVPNARVEIIQNIHSVFTNVPALELRQGLLFIGHYLHSPNEDAIIYFINEILPLITERLGNINLYVLGSSATKAVLDCASVFVHIVGYVEDPKPWFDKARVFIAPLRYGAGMKGKIGLSLSYGLPVVSTLIGVEGMLLEDKNQVLIADSPGDFANSVVQLYQDPMLWQKLSKNGQAHITQYFSEEVAQETLIKILNSQ